MSPAATPPAIPIKGDAWNLLGYYGAENAPLNENGFPGYHEPAGNGKTAHCSFNSIGDSIFDKGFVSVWSYWEPDNPNVWLPFGRLDNLDPGAGYWVFATEGGMYAPTTACLLDEI